MTSTSIAMTDQIKGFVMTKKGPIHLHFMVNGLMSIFYCCICVLDH